MAKAVDAQECYQRCSPNQHVQMQWIVENRSSQRWQPVNYIRNYCQDYARIKTFAVETKVNPKDIVVVSMMFYIPPHVQHDKIILQLRFETFEKVPFGDFLIGVIDLDPASNLDQSLLFEKNLSSSLKQSEVH